MGSVSAQMLVPVAVHLAPPSARDRVVGELMSGLLAGIPLSRPAASLIDAAFGWRGLRRRGGRHARPGRHPAPLAAAAPGPRQATPTDNCCSPWPDC